MFFYSKKSNILIIFKIYIFYYKYNFIHMNDLYLHLQNCKFQEVSRFAAAKENSLSLWICVCSELSFAVPSSGIGNVAD